MMNLSKSDIVDILTLKKDSEKQEIFHIARSIRDEVFGKKVFMYGFVYFSSYCKNNCTFCYYRKDNNEPARYRITLERIVNTAKNLADSGVHLIDLTMGEDEFFLSEPSKLHDIIKAVKAKTGLPVMVSPGVLETSAIAGIKRAGADFYALYQESFDREIYNSLRINQPYDNRIYAKNSARKKGLLIEDGILTGQWDNAETLAESILKMNKTNPQQLRVMTFIPQKGTPFYNEKPVSFENELLVTAILRILNPDKLIPASLDVDGIKGLSKRLGAGANVVTSLIPPDSGLKGVATAEDGIENGERTVAGIAKTLYECGLTAASTDEYKEYLSGCFGDRRAASGARDNLSCQEGRILCKAC
jgi:methylornithine synthase